MSLSGKGVTCTNVQSFIDFTLSGVDLEILGSVSSDSGLACANNVVLVYAGSGLRSSVCFT